MSNRRDLFRTAAKTGLVLGLAAAGQPLIALPDPGDEKADDAFFREITGQDGPKR